MPLTTLEVRLLQYLGARMNCDVSREDLLRDIWGYHESAITRAVDSAVTRLRNKIETEPEGAAVHGSAEPSANVVVPPSVSL